MPIVIDTGGNCMAICNLGNRYKSVNYFQDATRQSSEKLKVTSNK